MSTTERFERTFESAREQLDDLRKAPEDYILFEDIDFSSVADEKTGGCYRDEGADFSSVADKKMSGCSCEDDGLGIYTAPPEHSIAFGHLVLGELAKAAIPPPVAGSNYSGGIFLGWDAAFYRAGVTYVVLWIFPNDKDMSLISDAKGQDPIEGFLRDDNGVQRLVQKLKLLLRPSMNSPELAR